MARICCYRTGEVFIAKRGVPRNAMCLLNGHGARLRRVLVQNAADAGDGRLIIPGVAEAATDLQAALAAKTFEIQLLKALAISPWRRSNGGLL